MTKIYLARHGQNVDNANGILNGHRDEPLTDIGIGQAKELADKIKGSGLKFDKVYSSPLSRAYETAEIVADVLGMSKPTKLDGLIERDFGIMTGKPANSIEVLCSPNIIKTNTITYFLSPEGAETFPQLIERAKTVLKFINENHENKTVLLVSHGDFGKMVYAAYYELDWQQVLTMFHFGNSELLLLSEDLVPENAQVFNIAQYNH